MTNATDPAAMSGAWDVEPRFSGRLTRGADGTADGAHVFWLEDLPDGQCRFVWDGRAGAPFDLVPQPNDDPVVFSPNECRVAYYGYRDSDFFIGVDEDELGPYHDVTRSVSPTFSPDGSHLAFGASIGDHFRIVLDGRALGSWRAAPVPPAFSPDGARLAFVAENRKLSEGESDVGYQQWVVLDGTDLPRADRVAVTTGGLQFSPDSRRIAFDTISDGELRFVVDGVASRPYLDTFGSTFSPDSRRFAYAAQLEKSMAVVVNEQIGPLFREVSRPVFSPDSSRIAYLAVEGRSGLLGRFRTITRSVVDGAVSLETWDGFASDPEFSPDSAHIAFSVRRGKQHAVVLDGAEAPFFDMVSPPRFGPTGRVAYMAKAGTSCRLVVDGAPGQPMEQPAEFAPDQFFVFSPDGAHVACGGFIDGGWRPIVDERVGPAFAGIGRARFDGDRVLFLAANSDGVFTVSTQVG